MPLKTDFSISNIYLSVPYSITVIIIIFNI